MSKPIKIENDVEKKIQLKIKYQNNKIFKESFFASQENVKMKTFFKTNFSLIQKEIESENYVIYFLINDIQNKVYIGKSKNFSARLQNHYQNKLFNRIIMLSSNNWTSSIIDYLEYWFIDFFIKNNEFKLENYRVEKKPNINSLDEELIDNALNVFKWLLLTEGFNIDHRRKIHAEIIKEKIENYYEYFSSSINKSVNHEKKLIDVYFKGVKANYFKNEIRSQKLLLSKDTKVIWNKFSFESNPGSKANIKKYDEWFKDNIKKNNIKPISSNEYILIENIKTSLSQGACLICGYFSQNGKTAWKTLDGKSIRELENEQDSKNN